MKAKFQRMYVSKKGNDTFVYTVDGTPAELAQFKADQGENARHLNDDPKQPLLFFTTRVGASTTVDLIRTASGNWIIDNSVLRAKANLVAQYGGNLGMAMAQQIAGEISFGSSQTVAAPANQEAPIDEKANLNEPEGKKK